MPAKKKQKLTKCELRPKKNPQGTSAGIPRASGQRDSPVSGGPGVNFVSLMIYYILPGRVYHCTPRCSIDPPPGFGFTLQQTCSAHLHILPALTFPHQRHPIQIKEYQTNITQDENDEYCSACGGNGDLVCCDGCTRAFHLICVDPPMESVSQLPPDWYCVSCGSLRTGPGATHRRRGLFGELTMLVEKRNPSAFHLPFSIRDWFEGVRTGPEGEYEEGNPPKK